MDVIDRANESNEFFRERAIRDALKPRYRDREQPLVIDGVRCCLDCEEPIDPRRLEKMPCAVRCTECQGRKERCQ